MALRRALLHRLPFEREFTLQAGERRLELAPAGSAGWHVHEDELTLLMSGDEARALGRVLAARPGCYRADGPIAVTVVGPRVEAMRDSD
jgi:hypothetical protein